MKDPIQQFEENQKVNEALFGGLNLLKPRGQPIFQVYKDGTATVLSLDGKLSRVKRFFADPTIDLKKNSTWDNILFSFLRNASFDAEHISFQERGITFSGRWISGDFRGRTFSDYGGVVSSFEGGRFIGKLYNAVNESYKADPMTFISGIFVDNKGGILGRNDLGGGKFTEGSVQLIQIPVGSIFEIVDLSGVKTQIMIKKRLDEVDQNFVFKIMNSGEEKIVTWEYVRLNYQNVGWITIGKSYVITNLINTKQVKSISVKTSGEVGAVGGTSEAVKKDFINFSKEVEDFPYGKVLYFSFMNEEEHKKFTRFKNDLVKGTFKIALERIRAFVQSGDIGGYENHPELKQFFNNVAGDGAVGPGAEQMLAYLSEFKQNLINRISGGYHLKADAAVLRSDFINFIKKYIGINQIASKKQGKPASNVAKQVIAGLKNQ